jgi:hypothetical protein
MVTAAIAHVAVAATLNVFETAHTACSKHENSIMNMSEATSC